MNNDFLNCKNSAQNAIKVAIFRLKIEKLGDTLSPNPTLL